MRTRKKIAIVLLTTLGIVFLGLFLYALIYSMDVIQSYEINSPTEKNHVLIASQGSDYKNEVVKQVIQELKGKNIYIKIIDATQLPTVQEEEWDLILIIHTWENWSPQPDASEFLSKSIAKGKIVTLSTSGSGNEKMEGVDGITSASILEQASADSQELIRIVNSKLSTKQ